jgi:Tfp pilus assembly protein PilF
MIRSLTPRNFARMAAISVLTIGMLLSAGCGRNNGDAGTSAAASPADSVMQKGLDALYRTGNPVDAVEAFRQVLALNPTHYGARFQLAKALDMSGKPEEARPIWQAVLSAAEGIKDTATVHTAQMRLAQPDTVSQAGMMASGLDLLYRKGDPAGAAMEFSKVLEKNPTHYGAHFQIARALDRAGKPDEARPHWEKVLTMAEAIKDKATADTARARLQRKP